MNYGEAMMVYQQFVRWMCVAVLFLVCGAVGADDGGRSQNVFDMETVTFDEMADRIDLHLDDYCWYLKQKRKWEREHEGEFEDELARLKEKHDRGEMTDEDELRRYKKLVGQELREWVVGLDEILEEVYEMPMIDLEGMGGEEGVDRVVEVINRIRFRVKAKATGEDVDRLNIYVGDEYLFVHDAAVAAEKLRKKIRLGNGVAFETMVERFTKWLEGYTEYGERKRKLHEKYPDTHFNFALYEVIDLKLDLAFEMDRDVLIEQGAGEVMTGMLKLVSEWEEEMPWEVGELCMKMEKVLFKVGDEASKRELAWWVDRDEYDVFDRMRDWFGGGVSVIGGDHWREMVDDERYQSEVAAGQVAYKEMKDLIWGRRDDELDVELKAEWEKTDGGGQLHTLIRIKNKCDHAVNIKGYWMHEFLRLYMTSEDGERLLLGQLNQEVDFMKAGVLEVGESEDVEMVFELK
ncbi:hypothetical protein JD969_13655 [Planctomycetota bacterium]|nr:hypothetical protein JD969_13655 [Planctomycetota bacterium]